MLAIEEVRKWWHILPTCMVAEGDVNALVSYEELKEKHFTCHMAAAKKRKKNGSAVPTAAEPNWNKPPGFSNR